MCFGKVSAEFVTVSASVRVDGWVCVCQCVTSARQRKNETCTRRVSCVLTVRLWRSGAGFAFWGPTSVANGTDLST